MTEPRDSGNWAKPVEELHVGDVDEGAARGNVEGRKLVGPLQGFGQMWQKTYRVRIPGTTPEDIVTTWKERYGDFWPDYNNFYPPPAGIQPGEVAVIEGGKGPAKVSTGVMVMYVDDRSFSYMTPEGHPFAGMITFSAHEADVPGPRGASSENANASSEEAGPEEANSEEANSEDAASEDANSEEVAASEAQVQLLIRNNDPVYELSFKLFAGRMEDKMWQHTLRSLADAFESDEPVLTTVSCVDKKRQWKRFGNITKNSALRTMLRRDRRV